MSCTLSDVITYVPFEATNGDLNSPHDYLNTLLDLISRLRGGASRYVPLLMAKVAESMPNMANPLAHMPHTLDAFMDSSGSASSSPQEILKHHIPLRQPPQISSQQPMSSPALSSPMVGHMRQTPFSEGPQQQIHTPQQERLMFETYSPSVTGHGESPMTPPIFGMPGTSHHPFTPLGSQIPHSQPRSMPMPGAVVKQEVWDGYHG
jgi:hypothetical protein